MKFWEYLKGADHFWIMHLTYYGEDGQRLWQYARNKGLVGTDRRDMNKDWNTLYNFEKREYYKNSQLGYTQFQVFCNTMRKNDIITIIEGQQAILGIGKLMDNGYDYSPDLKGTFFDHTRKVRWDFTWDYQDARRPLLDKRIMFTNTLQRVPLNGKYWQMLSDLNL